MRELLSLSIGYLLGSVLPADLLARARGVDIRAVGTRNPGTTNALEQLGLVPGLITLGYDASVGLASMYIASRLGLSTGWIYLAGLAAVVGHIFPIFFHFRGGQGMAAATGMLVYEMWVALTGGQLFWAGIAMLGVLAASVFVLTRSASVVGVLVVPVLELEVLLSSADWQLVTFMTALTGIIWVVQLSIVRQQHLFHLAAPVSEWLGKFRAPTHG